VSRNEGRLAHLRSPLRLRERPGLGRKPWRRL
jgi:hypothetical protein